jgi:hypothetical protein
MAKGLLFRLKRKFWKVKNKKPSVVGSFMFILSTQESSSGGSQFKASHSQIVLKNYMEKKSQKRAIRV